MSASEIPASFQRRPANGKRISAFATPSLARVLFCPRRTFKGQDVHLKPQLMSRMQDASFPPVEVLYASVDSPKFACDRSSYLFVGSFEGHYQMLLHSLQIFDPSKSTVVVSWPPSIGCAGLLLPFGYLCLWRGAPRASLVCLLRWSDKHAQLRYTQQGSVCCLVGLPRF